MEKTDIRNRAVTLGENDSGISKLTPGLCLVTYSAMVVLFIPTFYKLSTYGWSNANYSHGLLVLMVALWLLSRTRDVLQEDVDHCLHPFMLGLLLFGLFCRTTGSIFGSMVMESFAVIPVLIGTTGFLFGVRGAKRVLFPAAFLALLVPPPSFVIDMVTAPLQLLVTTSTAFMLKTAGYLVNRDGVVLQVADYTIIVGEPCSGLRSMISMVAVGAVYVYLQETTNLKRFLLFFITIPIAIIANVFRLLFLSLITYHFGEAAGQGFLHDFSGYLLLIAALVCLMIVDVLINKGGKALKTNGRTRSFVSFLSSYRRNET